MAAQREYSLVLRQNSDFLFALDAVDVTQDLLKVVERQLRPVHKTLHSPIKIVSTLKEDTGKGQED